MDRGVGAVAGLAFGFLGLAAGLHYSWAGFASQPHGPFAFGIFCGGAGALIGLTCVFYGFVLRRLKTA